MVYATVEELSEFTGITENNLPSKAEKMLERASELIDVATLNRINHNDYGVLEIAKNATCAQVEYWISVGEDIDIEGAPNTISVGDMEIDFMYSNAGALLANRAKRYLMNNGLLYHGVGVK